MISPLVRDAYEHIIAYLPQTEYECIMRTGWARIDQFFQLVIRTSENSELRRVAGLALALHKAKEELASISAA